MKIYAAIRWIRVVFCSYSLYDGNSKKFVVGIHDDLNLPYPFAMKLGFISSPMFLGLLIGEDSYEVAGAVSFVYGMGANQHENRHVCQIEAAYLREAYRGIRLLARGLQKPWRLRVFRHQARKGFISA